ncbi:hypothetical protein D3C76_344750 [compost metagenome]
MRACPEAGAGLTGAHQNVSHANGDLGVFCCYRLSPGNSRLPGPVLSRVNPPLYTCTGRRVGAGSPAKRPDLPANFYPSFTVAATTVFAGKPANTPDQCRTQVGGWTQAAVGFTRERTRPDRHIKKKSLAAGFYPSIVLSSRQVEARGGSGTIRSSPQTELRPKIAQTIGESAIKANSCAAISAIPSSIQSQLASVNRLLAFPSLSPAPKLMPFCMNTRMISQAA